GPPGARRPLNSCSGSRSAALALEMQVQIAEIDDQPQALTEDEDRVVAMNGVNGQHDATQDAEIPEGHRHDDALFPLARPPLDDKAHHEQTLPAKTDDDPDQRFPVVAEHQWYSSPMASRTSRMVSR